MCYGPSYIGNFAFLILIVVFALAFRPEIELNNLHLALAIKKIMPFTKIWVHAVWSTKKRETLLDKAIRPNVFEHIHQNALEKDILMDIVGGYSDHVHCLFRLRNDQSISKVMQLIKGESSFWINQQGLIASKFQWQDEYFAVSVSESGVDDVRRYIATQEDHHKVKSYTQEYQEFIKKYNFQVFKDED
jgi:putative transposase